MVKRTLCDGYDQAYQTPQQVSLRAVNRHTERDIIHCETDQHALAHEPRRCDSHYPTASSTALPTTISSMPHPYESDPPSTRATRS